MNFGTYIEMNILSCLLCLILFYQQRRHKVFGFLGTTSFNFVVWSAVGILFADTLSWAMLGNVLPHSDTVLMSVQSIYYVLQAIIPMFFFLYCLDISGVPIPMAAKVFLFVPIVYTAVVLVMNFNGGFAFYILENHVKRGNGFLFVVLAPMIYIINSLILCIVFCVQNYRTSKEKFKPSVYMLVCIVINFLIAITCAFISSLTPWHVFVFSLVYLYIQLHSHQEQHLDTMAFIDPLTGLKTFAAFSRLKTHLNERLRENPSLPFALVIADVNYLKQVNDTYGHETGNALISSTARLFSEGFSHSPVCRIGGDEFLVILENSDYENRHALCKQLEEQIKTATFPTRDGELPVSVAFGMADYLPGQHTGFDSVFHAADEAMYEHKAQSRKNNTTH